MREVDESYDFESDLWPEGVSVWQAWLCKKASWDRDSKRKEVWYNRNETGRVDFDVRDIRKPSPNESDVLEPSVLAGWFSVATDSQGVEICLPISILSGDNEDRNLLGDDEASQLTLSVINRYFELMGQNFSVEKDGQGTLAGEMFVDPNNLGIAKLFIKYPACGFYPAVA